MRSLEREGGVLNWSYTHVLQGLLQVCKCFVNIFPVEVFLNVAVYQGGMTHSPGIQVMGTGRSRLRSNSNRGSQVETEK